jgi:hypothetical protein
MRSVIGALNQMIRQLVMQSADAIKAPVRWRGMCLTSILNNKRNIFNSSVIYYIIVLYCNPQILCKFYFCMYLRQCNIFSINQYITPFQIHHWLQQYSFK